MLQSGFLKNKPSQLKQLKDFTSFSDLDPMDILILKKILYTKVSWHLAQEEHLEHEEFVEKIKQEVESEYLQGTPQISSLSFNSDFLSHLILDTLRKQIYGFCSIRHYKNSKKH